MTALSYDDEIHLRAVAALGPDGGAPPLEVGKLRSLAREGLILAAVISGRCAVRITPAGQDALAQCRYEQAQLAEALAARCHELGGAGGQVTAEGLACFARLIADDEDAAILWRLWVARERASTELRRDSKVL